MRAHFQTTQNAKICLFIKTTTHLFASLGAAALSRTHRSRHGLHGVEAAFTLCLLLGFRARLLALSFSLPSQLLSC